MEQHTASQDLGLCIGYFFIRRDPLPAASDIRYIRQRHLQTSISGDVVAHNKLKLRRHHREDQDTQIRREEISTVEPLADIHQYRSRLFHR